VGNASQTLTIAADAPPVAVDEPVVAPPVVPVDPGVTGGTGGSGRSGGSSTATVGSAKVAATTAKIPVSCTGGGSGCSVSLTLSVTETVSTAKQKRRKVVVGRAKATLAAGESRTVSVSLNRAGKRRLATRRSLKVNLLVTQDDSNVASRALKFKRKPKTAAIH
jgi:hypothetical protein